MKYILEQIQVSRSEIVAQLMADNQLIQRNEPAVNCEPLKEEIENFSRKKRKEIDLMLDALISKDDLKKQTEFYLNCVPFGFRTIYTIHRCNRGHKLDVVVDRCEII